MTTFNYYSDGKCIDALHGHISVARFDIVDSGLYRSTFRLKLTMNLTTLSDNDIARISLAAARWHRQQLS